VAEHRLATEAPLPEAIRQHGDVSEELPLRSSALTVYHLHASEADLPISMQSGRWRNLARNKS
jgi:hypothetical protein